MNEQVEKKCHDLVQMLSCHRADHEDMQDAVSTLMLALTDAGAYIEDFPDYAWLADIYEQDFADPKLAEALFACALADAIDDFAVVGDKGDEIFDAVVDVLDDMDIEIDPPDFDRGNWSDYAECIETQLAKLNAKKRLVALDIDFSDNITVFVVESADYDSILGLVHFFNLKYVDSATLPKFNS
ncbi:hypothetical protein SAMN05428959_10767 [Duganella sp. CF517]|uniref:hypothetical protein n=1 Tax=Duganella sp. CF517 TaxID=1881038 RepID=UPI0008B7D0D2|nr:hypothetical protein [Duganella sp. CF517]SEO37290.1 hypothetical protein SAMN05428959_10767 [Duganella sp. CF517]